MVDPLYSGYPHGTLDPQVRDFLARLALSESRPLSSLTPDQVRQTCSILDWTAAMEPLADIADTRIAGPGGPVALRIYTPHGDGPFPLLVYFHGGGWVFGNLDEADPICSALAHGASCVVISVDYRLSPENKYPAALDDAYAACAWAAENAFGFRGDPRRLAVAGESAGANLSTVVAQMARERGGPRLAFQLLICPVTNLSSFETDSHGYFAEGVWLPRKNLEYYYEQYLQHPEQALDPRVSPLLAPDLSRLPPAHIITAEFDVLRDEGERYAGRLEEAGVPVTCSRYRGMIHSFPILNGVFDRAKEAITESSSALRAAFDLTTAPVRA